MSAKKELWIYTLVLLVITNVIWYAGFSIFLKDEGNVAAVLLLGLGSFMPAIIAVIMCKINKLKLRTLLINPHIKKSWKVYLTAIAVSLLIVYSTDLLPLLFFPKDVMIASENLTLIFFGRIILFTVLSAVSSIELLGEELGWMGYLFPRLEKEYGTYLSIPMVALIRTLWHLVYIIKIDGTLFGVCYLFLSNLSLQSVLVYVTKKSDSVFPAAVVHAVTNIMFGLSFVTYTEEFYKSNRIKFDMVGLIPLIIIGAVFFTLLFRHLRRCSD